MSMRISELALAGAALFLAACSSHDAPDPVAAAPDEDRIECALGGATDFGRDCSVERGGAYAGELIVRHRDGGFRRLLITADGRGVVAADGAEPARVAVIAGDRIEVTLGGDRYRLPATIKGAVVAER